MNKPKYIEAERFVECFGNWYTEEGTENGFIGTIKDLVKQTPAEDVQEVRHGRWIENETAYADPPTKQTCNCSICGKASTRPLGDWCRWCGAKMDEVEE